MRNIATNQKREIRSMIWTQKTDIYRYDIFQHKPKYVYTTESKRLKKNERHFGIFLFYLLFILNVCLDKFANDPAFKKSVAKFFAIEHEFPQPNYSDRKPLDNMDDLETCKSLYYLFNFKMVFSEQTLWSKESFPSLINSTTLILSI